MKKLILPIIFLHLVIAVNAATYYFSASTGSDSRTTTQAKNPATPWKTLTKLNSIMSLLSPGDSVLFKCRDTFYPIYNASVNKYDNLNVTVGGNNSARITFSSYGTGVQPVISGFFLATNWTQVSTNIWEAPFTQPSGKENIVIANNQEQPIGRYPNPNAANGGYLNIDATNGTSMVTSNALPSTPNWAGADVVVRKDRWSLDRLPITAQSGNTLTFTPQAGTESMQGVGYGFFICNSPNTLDQNGEWFYDANAQKLRMYFSNNNPSAYTVWASGVDTLVRINLGNSYLTFSNLSFQGANQYAISSDNSSYITINNCTFNFTGIDAINALSAQYNKIQNCNISNTNNCGINLYWNCNNTSILNDTVKNTALIAALGQNSQGITRSGIKIRGNGNLIQYCEVDTTGYNGIHFDGDLNVVKNCYVNTFGLVVDDGGGIYTHQDDFDTSTQTKYILNNIVVSGIGASLGTSTPNDPASHGYYLDGNTNHTTVLNNTAANCSAFGIFTHGSCVVDIKNNTFYGNRIGQFYGDQTKRTDMPSSVTFKKNICFSKTMTQLAVSLTSYNGTNDLPSIGTFDSNYYCRPLDSGFQFKTQYQIGTGNSTQYYKGDENFSLWQSFLRTDLHSKGTPATISPFKSTNLSGINMFPQGNFTSSNSIDYVGIFSSKNDISKTLLPNKLDGSTLQISASSYSSNSFMITLATDSSAITGQGYRLSFTLQGAAGGGYMTVYLRNQQTYETVSEQAPLATAINIPIPTSRQDFTFGFIPVNFTGKIAIEMDVPYPTGAIWIDNVTLQRATITPTNADDYIVFQYNPANTTKTFTLSGTYYDAKGATYSGTVTLQPYTSLVLFKQYTAPSFRMAQPFIKSAVANNISFKVNPNPAGNIIHLYFDRAIQADDHLDKDITIYNEAGVMVQTVTLPSTENLSKMDVNVGGLQKGIYLISVSFGGRIYTKKFIKQ